MEKYTSESIRDHHQIVTDGTHLLEVDGTNLAGLHVLDDQLLVVDVLGPVETHPVVVLNPEVNPWDREQLPELHFGSPWISLVRSGPKGASPRRKSMNGMTLPSRWNEIPFSGTHNVSEGWTYCVAPKGAVKIKSSPV